MKSYARLIILLFTCVAISSEAEDPAPNLTETIAYITDKLGSAPPVRHAGKNGVIVIHGMKVNWFNAGILCVETRRDGAEPGGQPKERIIRYEMPLAYLSGNVPVIQEAATDPKSPNVYGIVLAIAPGTGQRGAIYSQEGSDMVKARQKITLWFKNEDTANRLARAFQRAIELSGGKKELFGN